MKTKWSTLLSHYDVQKYHFSEFSSKNYNEAHFPKNRNYVITEGRNAGFNKNIRNSVNNRKSVNSNNANILIIQPPG